MTEKAKELINLLYADRLTQFGKRQLADLIEKQQKEIENLKEINEEHQKLNGELRDEIKRQGNTREIEEKYVEENYINKNKIREEIEELNNMKVDGETFTTAINFAIKILKELLEEE